MEIRLHPLLYFGLAEVKKGDVLKGGKKIKEWLLENGADCK